LGLTTTLRFPPRPGTRNIERHVKLSHRKGEREHTKIGAGGCHKKGDWVRKRKAEARFRNVIPRTQRSRIKDTVESVLKKEEV